MWAAFLCLLLGCLYQASAILTPVTDPISWDKYLVSYVPPKSWEHEFASNNTALSLGRIINVGDQMACYVPNNLTGFFNLSGEMDEENLDEFQTSVLEAGVEIITTAITECLTYFSGFWKYEYCPNKTLSQFHGDPKATSLFYVLARADVSLGEREFRLLYNDFGYYISELIGSGDICDMTGKPRVVDLQYVCGPAAGSASIKWIRELKTCHYEVQLAVPSLCDLDLLSKNGDKKYSTPLTCSKLSSSRNNVVDIIAEYEPTFMGNELYLLTPYNMGENTSRTALLYTGKVLNEASPNGRESDAFSKKFRQVIGRLLLQELILMPDGLPYINGDELSWMCEVLDPKGNFLTMAQFNVSALSLPQITIDPSLRFEISGNFLYFRRNVKSRTSNHLDFKGEELLLGSQESPGLSDVIKFVLVDNKVNSGDQLILGEADHLLEDILSPEQLADLLEKLGRSKQERKIQNEKENEDKKLGKEVNIADARKEVSEEGMNGKLTAGHEFEMREDDTMLIQNEGTRILHDEL